jgi:DsbC/DsbD-like thiol-disulfide interchange protein
MRIRSGWAVVALAGLLGGAGVASAQNERTSDRVFRKVEASVEPAEVRRGQAVTWKLTVELAPGWHTYPTRQPDQEAEPFTSELQFKKAAGGLFVGELKEPTPMIKAEPALNIKALHYMEGKMTWERTLVIPPDAKPGELKVTVPVRLQACDERGCLPPKTITATATVRVSDAPPVAVDPRYQNELNGSGAGAKPPVK